MNDKKLFRIIVRRSWDLLFKRPSMWILAFFASAVSGMGVIEAVWGSWSMLLKGAGSSASISLTSSSPKIFSWLLPPYNNVLLPIFALLFISASVILFFVSVISLGALIRAAVDKIEHTLKTSWVYGVIHVWEMTGIIVLRKIFIFALLFLSVFCGSYLLKIGSLFATVLGIVLAILFVSAVVVINFLAVYAETAIVIDRVSLLNSIKKSWQVFREHVLLSIEMAVLMFIIELVFLFLSGIVFVLIVIPVFLLYVMTGITGMSIFFSFGLFIGFLLLVALAFVVAALSTMFMISSWSYLYVRVRGGIVKSRIMQLFCKN